MDINEPFENSDPDIIHLVTWPNSCILCDRKQWKDLQGAPQPKIAVSGTKRKSSYTWDHQGQPALPPDP